MRPASRKPAPRRRGVKRQYMGCAGRVANGINTVHLSYVRQHRGHGLIGFRQWIPREQIEDPAVRERMGLPGELAFATKGELAVQILADARADGMVTDFVCGDEVYGSCPVLRCYLEDHAQGYVLRVAKTFLLTLGGGRRLSCAGVVSTAGAASALTSTPASACPAALDDRLGRDRLQRRARLCLGLDRHRQPPALAAHPPAPGHRRMRLPLLPHPRRPAGLVHTADHRGRAALAGRGEL